MLAVAAAPATPAAQEEEINPWVTAAVQVSPNQDPSRGHSTPLITRNPKNGVLIIADCEARTKRTVRRIPLVRRRAVVVTHGNPMTRPWTDSCVQPDSNINHTLVYDKNGVLYLAFVGSARGSPPSTVPNRPVHSGGPSRPERRADVRTVRVYEAPEAPEADSGLKRN